MHKAVIVYLRKVQLN